MILLFFNKKESLQLAFINRCSQVSMAAKHLGVSSKPSQAETEPPEAQHLEGAGFFGKKILWNNPFCLEKMHTRAKVSWVEYKNMCRQIFFL